MKIEIWGARGSIPAPGPETMRYGGNTSCVELTLSDGSALILDAGTGIRQLGAALRNADPSEQPINILLTHLHMDHIQGLMFFAPMFCPDAQITIYGPATPATSLQDRIARYISAPLAPVEVRELPSKVFFREAMALEWSIGPAHIRAQAVNHRGPTLGYRIEDAGVSLCYIPDHEPGLGASLADLREDWISGFELGHDATLLIHDCQYTDEEYPDHLGWGHCPVSDALAFARRVAARSVLLFHHDPLHADGFLDAVGHDAGRRWHELGGDPSRVSLAFERQTLELGAGEPAAASNGASAHNGTSLAGARLGALPLAPARASS
jgi:phosphoribosyl 1,2-cyclic phosphodiesterase